MTTTEAPATARPHSDGGTYIVLQTAETQNGWAIAITRWTTYRGAVRFEILRVAPDGASVRLDEKNTEAEARVVANQMWKRDR
jgi:hypothetical protein